MTNNNSTEKQRKISSKDLSGFLFTCLFVSRLLHCVFFSQQQQQLLCLSSSSSLCRGGRIVVRSVRNVARNAVRNVQNVRNVRNVRNARNARLSGGVVSELRAPMFSFMESSVQCHHSCCHVMMQRRMCQLEIKTAIVATMCVVSAHTQLPASPSANDDIF